MPWSSNAGKPFVIDYFNKIDPNVVVDVGPGNGTYSKLLRKPNQYWVGVEIWAPYIEKYNLQDFYNKIIVSDVVYWDAISCDICICGDVIEHLKPSDARKVIRKLRQVADHLIISIPICYVPQDAFEGNPYERHIDPHWTYTKMFQTAGQPTEFVYFKDENNIDIGIFVYTK